MKTKQIAFGSIIIAIIMLMAFVPQLGYLKINLVDVTIIHIPVLIMALSFNDKKMALIAGITFGLSSWFVALSRPSTPIDFLFQNPIISVLPRIIFAMIAYYVYQGLVKKINRYPAQLISIFISVVLHTVMVMSLLYYFGKTNFDGTLLTVLIGVMSANGGIELILALISVPIIVNALKKALRI